MAQPLREGPTRGKIVDSGIQEPQPGKATCFQIKVECTGWFGTSDDQPDPVWFPIEHENTEIVLYLYITKKDGTLNERTIEEIRKALVDEDGNPVWDGRSFSTLHALDLFKLGIGIQFSCKLEEYNGKQTMKASFPCAFDAKPHVGSISKAGDASIKNLDAQFGSKLRAIAPPPARTTAAPGARPPAPPAAPPAQHPAIAAKAATAGQPGSDHAMAAAGDSSGKGDTTDDIPF